MNRSLKMGLLWGFFTAITINALKIPMDDKSFEEVFISSRFLIELALYLFIGGLFFYLALKSSKHE